MSGKYEKNGFELPRCTDIIDDCTNISFGLKKWAAAEVVRWIRKHGNSWPGCWLVDDEDLNRAEKAYETTGQTALDVGSEVHNAIEVFLKREIARKGDGEAHWDITDPVYAKLSGQAMKAFNAFNAWQKEHDIKPIVLEQTVYSESGCWAGTCDFLGYFDGKLYVIDWKSSKAFYPEMRYQVAAYRSAVGDTQLDIVGCGVLRLDKTDGTPEWKDTSKSYEKDLRIFNRMVDLYFERHPQIAKKAGWNIPF